MILAGSIITPKVQEYLTAGECVAFVGAGFSMACGMPSWNALLRQLLDEAEKSIASDFERALLIDARDALTASFFPIAASGVRTLLSKEQLRRCLVERFDATKLNHLPQHIQDRMVARIKNLVLGPWAGIITTNYDTLIEKGFDTYSHAGPFRSDGSQNALGNVLCLPKGSGGFFVKLHGDTWADSQVLSTADYVHTWMTLPRVTHFLTAVMLRYRLVFIGCSIEDEVLRLRQKIWADFGEALPRAYALLPDNAWNRLRRKELKERAGLEPLLYPTSANGDGHEAVDVFLQESRRCADFRRQTEEMATLSSLRSRTIIERVEAIGSINRHLLALLVHQDAHRLKYSDMFAPTFQEQVKQGKSRHILTALSDGERLYRMMFLASLGFVEEKILSGDHYFVLSGQMEDYMRENPLSEAVE